MKQQRVDKLILIVFNFVLPIFVHMTIITWRMPLMPPENVIFWSCVIADLESGGTGTGLRPCYYSVPNIPQPCVFSLSVVIFPLNIKWCVEPSLNILLVCGPNPEPISPLNAMFPAPRIEMRSKRGQQSRNPSGGSVLMSVNWVWNLHLMGVLIQFGFIPLVEIFQNNLNQDCLIFTSVLIPKDLVLCIHTTTYVMLMFMYVHVYIYMCIPYMCAHLCLHNM